MLHSTLIPDYRKANTKRFHIQWYNATNKFIACKKHRW